MNIYNLNNININSIIRVASECAEGERMTYSGCCFYYELIFCLSGKSSVIFQKINLFDTPGVIRYLPQGIKNNTYYVDNIKSGECIDIMFTTDNPMPDTVFSIDFSSNINLRQLFIKIHNVWVKKQIGYYNRCISLFYNILYEMEKSQSGYSPKAYNDKISNGINYIHEHYNDVEFDYSKLAEVCGVSYTYFKKLFIKIYNTTPSEYVKHLKIQNACELLNTKRFSVSQVAEMCGYSNLYYFSKVFKDTIGTPPSEYTV